MSINKLSSEKIPPAVWNMLSGPERADIGYALNTMANRRPYDRQEMAAWGKIEGLRRRFSKEYDVWENPPLPASLSVRVGQFTYAAVLATQNFVGSGLSMLAAASVATARATIKENPLTRLRQAATFVRTLPRRRAERKEQQALNARVSKLPALGAGE